MQGVCNISVMMVLAGVTLLAPDAQADEDSTVALSTTLHQRFPEIKIDAVTPAPIPGLYEVFTGEHVAYADKTGDYLILGRLVDTRTRHDLSEEHLDARRSIDFKKLPFGNAIKIVKGDGSRQIALFEDPDCPYCQQLEQALRPMTDLTAYVFLYPLDNLHPNATAHARAIWCSPDRSLAWTAWMTERTVPAAFSCAGDPLSEIHDLAESLRVASTPTLFLADGRRVGGALSTAELEALLGRAPTAAR